jgi:sugar fermentation stimulation protein A
MKFDPPLLEGRFLGRRKRFFADIELDGGERVVAHCANPGSMITCTAPDARVWLSKQDGPRRSLPWTWELVDVGGSLICVNTAAANRVVAEALASARIPELAEYDERAREVRFGKKSRLDFHLRRGTDRCFVEVKMVTLSLERGIGAFPDSVTERGKRHLEELIRIKRAGHRAVLLFCSGRAGTRAVRPAHEIDPTYAKTLRRAVARGVEVIAYGCSVTPRRIVLGRRIDVRL